jgi:hypothetical protein
MLQYLLIKLGHIKASIQICVYKKKFLFSHKSMMSNRAFYYLLNGGQEPLCGYSYEPINVKNSYYLQSYIDKEGKQRLRNFDSYFTRPQIEGTELITFRLCKYSPNFVSQFYFQTLEKLAEYHEQKCR